VRLEPPVDEASPRLLDLALTGGVEGLLEPAVTVGEQDLEPLGVRSPVPVRTPSRELPATSASPSAW